MSTTVQKLRAVNKNGLHDANISANEQAVLDELFAYDRENSSGGDDKSGAAYDKLSFAEKLANLTDDEIQKFASKNGLSSIEINKLNDIFDDAEASLNRTNITGSQEKKNTADIRQAYNSANSARGL